MKRRDLLQYFIQGYGVTFVAHMSWEVLADLVLGVNRGSTSMVLLPPAELIIALLLLTVTARILAKVFGKFVGHSLFAKRAAVAGLLWYLVVYSAIRVVLSVDVTYVVSTAGLLGIAYAYFKLIPEKKIKRLKS